MVGHHSLARTAPSGNEPPGGSEPERYVALVELLRARPSEGLLELHARFSVTVSRLLARVLGPDADAEDIAQQVFLKVCSKISQLEDPRKLESWIHRITINEVRHVLRRRLVRRVFVAQRKDVLQCGNLADEVEARDLLRQCLLLLDTIPSEERVVFVLHFVEGYRLDEVAEMCGFSHVTAKRRLRAAHRRFDAALKRFPALAGRLVPRPRARTEE